MNIVLTGFMASGKTSISKAIADISGMTLVDTDDMIVEAENMSINEIFEKYGEKYFREAEHKAVCCAAEMDNAVISTGGGVVLNKENIRVLRYNGIIFNLEPDFEVIEERLTAAAATRPLLKNQDIEAVKKRFEERLPYYADCDRSVHIVKNKTPEEYAGEILETISENMEKISHIMSEDIAKRLKGA